MQPASLSELATPPSYAESEGANAKAIPEMIATRMKAALFLN
jgi:hypothetical protein